MNPFEIRVADLRRSRAAERDIELDVAVDWQLDLSRVDPDPAGAPNLHLALILTPVVGGLLVHGSGTCTARHTCHRCLNEWTEPMTVPISALFADMAQDDDEVFPLGDTIAIETAVRDDVVQVLRDGLHTSGLLLGFDRFSERFQLCGELALASSNIGDVEANG